tara:strand:- start:984 stop:1172 length:189 start_codon:yes stop_codon:yes gene_type:complete
MKNANEMTVEEFSQHLKDMNEKIKNFHLYGGSNVGKRTDRSYANQKRGNFHGGIGPRSKYDG